MFYVHMLASRNILCSTSSCLEYFALVIITHRTVELVVLRGFHARVRHTQNILYSLSLLSDQLALVLVPGPFGISMNILNKPIFISIFSFV